MKVIDPCHKYELENFEQKDTPGQIIQFIKKEPHPTIAGRLVTVSDGTTNEELLVVLIDRCEGLMKKMPSPETQEAIHLMREALRQLNARTRGRIRRGVEGTNQP